MGTWNSTKVGGGANLLPAGIRNFEITKAEARVNDRTGKREVALTLSSSAGSGEDTIPLEPWASDADSIEKWEGMLKRKAQGLGFEPSDGDASMQQITTEFALYADSLTGKVVEIDVTHAEAKDKQGNVKTKDNGEPFFNHRCHYRGITGGVGQPVAVAAAPSMDDVPW
jgi:hypothetical protein